MQKPQTIVNAQNLICGTLGVSAFCLLLNTVAGSGEVPDFLAGILWIGVMSTLPYFIGLGRNLARHIYVAVTCISAVSLLLESGAIKGSGRFDIYIALLLMPVQLYACGMLFGDGTGDWFKRPTEQKQGDDDF